MDKLISILILIRPKHWAKNVFVFFPVLFSGAIGNYFSFDIILVFLGYCVAASAIYVINDWVDVEKDRLHPEKKNRPIASGKISKSAALILFFLLCSALIGIGFLIEFKAFIYVLLYFVLNLAYSFYLKNFSILDVSCISLGFVFRVLAGGAQADLAVTNWMVILVFLLTISLAFAKRRDDFEVGIDHTLLRKSNLGYSLAFLDIAKSISFSITLVAYILYSIDPVTTKKIGSENLYLTSFFVFLGVMRYIQISVVDKNAGSPVKVLYKDKFIQLTLIGWALLLGYLLYG